MKGQLKGGIVKRELEDYLWERIPDMGDVSTNKSPRKIIQEMFESGVIQNHKQAWRTLDKWERQRIYEYGVTLDLGWKTGKLRQVFCSPSKKMSQNVPRLPDDKII